MHGSAFRGVLVPVLLAAATTPGVAQCEIADLVLPGELPSGLFGRSLDAAGTTIVVGAPNDEQLGENAGRVHVFELGPFGWARSATLGAWDAPADARFGIDVAIDDSATRIVVGAFTQGAGVPFGPGAAYVFERSGSTWVPATKLVAGDAAPNEWFGFAVDVEDGRIAVGAPNADLPPLSAFGPGAAYVFELGPSGWSEVAKIGPGAALPQDVFGGAVALEGTEIFVGTNQIDFFGAPQGPGLVAVHDGNVGWSATAILTPSIGGPSDGFGVSLAVEGDMLLVGAPRSPSTVPYGRAFVFERGPAGWSETAWIASGIPDEGFGAGVALRGDRALVGAPGAKNPALGATGTGGVYTLIDDPVGGWQATGLFLPSRGDIQYGSFVEIEGDLGIVTGLDFAHVLSLSESICPSLYASPPLLAAEPAGTQYLTLRAGPGFAGAPYLVLGSRSGTAPGITIDGVTLPLNPDGYFLETLLAANGPILQSTFGVLDYAGDGGARIVKPPLPPSVAGLFFVHAFLAFDLNGPIPLTTFASEARTLLLY